MSRLAYLFSLLSMTAILLLSACSHEPSDPDLSEQTEQDQAAPQVYDFTPVDLNSLSKVSNRFTRPRLSTNMLPGTMDHVDNMLTEGKMRVAGQGGRRPSKSLRVNGYFQPTGTLILQVDVSRLALAIEKAMGRDQKIALVDEEGWTYSPFGYWLSEGPDVEIGLDSRNYFRTLKELPPLPSSGENELILLFKPTIGAHIIGMKVGETVVATADFWVVAD